MRVSDYASTMRRTCLGQDSVRRCSVIVRDHFAIGMVFAESGNDEYRWIRRIVGYGIAGAAGYIRVKDNVHWLSDTVAGAALGIATARFVLNRRETESHASVQILSARDGWQLAYTVRTH